MRVLFVGGTWLGDMLKTIHDGFAALGHETLHVPYMGEHENPGALIDVAHHFEPQLTIGFCMARTAQRASLRAVREIPGVRMYWDFDQPQECLWNGAKLAQVLPCWHFATSTDDSALTHGFYGAAGVPVHWMPPLFDPGVCATYRSAKASLILMVGTGYIEGPFAEQATARAPRVKMVERLREEFGAENVSIYGSQWPDGWSYGPVGYEEQFDLYASAVINVGSMVEHPPTRSRTLNFRPVLCCGAGGFLLTDAHDGNEQCFEHEKELVYWESLDDLIAQADRWLDRPCRRLEIAAAGRERVLREYVPERWIPRIIEWAGRHG